MESCVSTDTVCSIQVADNDTIAEVPSDIYLSLLTSDDRV